MSVRRIPVRIDYPGGPHDRDGFECLILEHGNEAEDLFIITAEIKRPGLWRPDESYVPRVWRRVVTSWTEIPPERWPA